LRDAAAAALSSAYVSGQSACRVWNSFWWRVLIGREQALPVVVLDQAGRRQVGDVLLVVPAVEPEQDAEPQLV